jgi:hypothetical protein
MTQIWQNLAAAVLVVAACAYLFRQTWLVLARKKSSGCGSCAKCPAETETANGQPIVSIDAVAKSARKT